MSVQLYLVKYFQEREEIMSFPDQSSYRKHEQKPTNQRKKKKTKNNQPNKQPKTKPKLKPNNFNFYDREVNLRIDPEKGHSGFNISSIEVSNFWLFWELLMLHVMYWYLLSICRNYKLLQGFVQNLRKTPGHSFILTVYICIIKPCLLILIVCTSCVAYAISLILSRWNWLLVYSSPVPGLD